MAAPIWYGGTTAVSQIDDFTPANVQVSDVFTLTLTDEAGVTLATVNFTATVATVANVTAGLAAAWQASAIAILYATAADNTTTVKLTAKTAGVPFYVASSATDGGGANTQTLTRAATTANAGPNAWSTAANWSTLAVPVSTDDVVLDARGGSNAIYYGLNQASVTLTSLRTYMGGPQIGTSSFALKIGATTAEFGLPATDGSKPSGNFTNINYGTVQTTTNVWDSATTGSNGLAPVTLAGTHASNAINVYGGIVQIGTMTPAQSATFATINVRAGKLTTGSGTDWTTYTQNGGTVILGKSATSGTAQLISGDLTINGVTKTGAFTGDGGTLHYNARLAGDDFGTLTMNSVAVDLSANTAVVSATTFAVKKGGSIRQFITGQFSVTTATTFDFTQGTSLTITAAN